MVVLVTGSSGQLGQSLQSIAPHHKTIQFVFCDTSYLDITNFEKCLKVFEKHQPNYCINAAAYTAVDKAETELEKAYAINVIGAKNIAEVCKAHQTVLLHLSTDFVFDGNKRLPYTEEDIPNPISVYGKTKWEGEKMIQQIWEKHYILRSSWVYSQFGHNFMKTMLRLASESNTITVVNDQIGSPTHAIDLAKAILWIITVHNQQPTVHNFGIYNFSNEGQCSWYDFAKKIFEINKISVNLTAIPTTSFPTAAKRPAFSVLDKSKIKKTFGLSILKWEDNLQSS